MRLRRFARLLFTGIFLFVACGNVFAQQDLLDRLFRRNREVDSLEVAKPRKPLESYFFDDSLRNRLMFTWHVIPGTNQIDTTFIDTMLNRFEIDYAFLEQNDVGAAYLGNLGAAARPLNFFRWPAPENFIFLTAYDSYLYTPERVRFYNVKRPFTNLSYYTSGQARIAEEQLRVTHAQNVSPSTGMNIEYQNRNTKGMYSSQRSKDKNFSYAVSHTGKRYSIHGGYIYNMGEIRENGGIKRDSDVTDTIYNPPYAMEVNLRDAKNEFKWNSFYVTQAYGIPLQRVTDEDFSIADKSSLFFGHAFEYTQVKKKYTDTRANSSDFYDHWYIYPNQSLDSINEMLLDNKLFVQIQPFDRDGIIGTIDAGIGYAMNNYYYFDLNQYLYEGGKYKKNDTYVYGSIQGKLKKYIDWDAGIVYHPVGFRSQDLKLNATLGLSAYFRSRPVTLTVSGLFESRSPNFWEENYFSNHIYWNNSFDKETETRIEGKLEIPSVGFEAGVWQSMMQDRIYYGEDAKPRQHGGNISVSGLFVRKDFKAGIFRFNHRVLMQWSSNDNVVAVPAVSAYAAWFMDFHLVRDVLRMQLGIDGWYNTEYYAPAYSPATMQFYNQREKKLGNYPLMDAFLSAKWKRMRILVKLQHVNENLFGERNYFSVLHHPLNRRMFKLGFSWSFYD